MRSVAARAVGGSGKDLWPIAVITAMYVVLVALVSPHYEVPQNDDWAYFLSVKQWFETGHVSDLGWNDPTLLFQLLWGGMFARLLGLSYSSLRWSTLSLSWIGVMSVFGLLRRCGASREVALFGAGSMMLHPVFLTLSYSFNTDVPYLSVATFATYLYVRALDQERLRPYLFAGLALACAYLIRQQGMVLALGASGFVLWRGSRPRLPRALTLLGPVLAAVVLHIAWFHAEREGMWPWQLGNIHPFFHHPSLAGGGALLVQMVQAGAAGVLEFAVPACPVALAALAGGMQEPRLRAKALGLVLSFGALFSAAALWCASGQSPAQRGWPFVGNYLTRAGALPPLAASGTAVPPAAWQGLTWSAPVLAGCLAMAAAVIMLRARRGAQERAAVVTLGLCLLQVLPSLAAASIYDRYFILLLPGIAVTASLWHPRGRAALAAAAGLTCVLGGLSLEWTRAYVDQSRAYWEVAEEAESRGIPPEEIQLGFEWEGAHLFLEARQKLGARPPFDLDHGYPWSPLLRPRHLVGLYRPDDPGIIARRSFRPFLARHSVEVAVNGP